MRKRQLHHHWRKFRFIKPWYFLLIAAVFGYICVMALRANNTHMAQLRTAVYSADEKGTGVVQALQNLQVYVTSHMNTNLTSPNTPYPPIQLKNTYDRLVQASGETANAANSSIYTDAQHYCEQAVPDGFSGRYRIDCIQNYVSSHGVELPNIPDSMYKFNFISPLWSPDLAGWSLLISIVSLILFLAVFIIHRWIRKQTN